MRSSHVQFEMMVDFMEANGDLSKPTGGPRGRNYIQCKWRELTLKLNSDGTGDPRSEEKWRKVWSDLKNNTKKKCARVTRASSGTGGGPALQLSLTDLENRVMQIIGVQAATGMQVEEAGFQQESDLQAEVISEIDWNTPSTSQPPVIPPVECYPTPSAEANPPPPTVAHPPLTPDVHPAFAPSTNIEWAPPQKRRKKDLSSMFLDADRKSREYARERERVYDELEKERLRLKNEELRVKELEMKERVRQRDEELRLQAERVRQRDDELRLQAQWLEFMKGGMEVFVRYMDRK